MLQIITLGGIHKLCSQDFANFDPLVYVGIFRLFQNIYIIFKQNWEIHLFIDLAKVLRGLNSYLVVVVGFHHQSFKNSLRLV